MENQKPSVKKIALNYGFILGLFSILVLVLVYALNLEQDWKVSVVSLLVSILIFTAAIKAYRKADDGILSLGDAIKVGLATAAIGGIIAAIYSYIHYSYINPEYIHMIIENAQTSMLEQNPDMPQEQIDMGINMTKKFSSPFMMGTFSLIGSLFFGFIISLIAGLVLQNKRPEATM